MNLKSFKPIYSSFFRNQKSIVSKSLLLSTTLFFVYQKKFYSQKLSLEDQFKKLSLSGFEHLQEGEMKQLKYGTGDKDSILIVKYGGKLRALSNYCPHFGAPMHTGVLIDNVLKCPWHGASFDIETGAMDISPSLDGLELFDIIEENNEKFVKLPNVINNSKVAQMAKRDQNNKTRYLILGGGPAGLAAAETLRQGGFTGEILVVSSDANLPYDRTLLSKFLPPIDKLLLRGKSFYDEYGIQFKLNSTAVDVDAKEKVVVISNGEKITYDKLLIATGSSAITPQIEGIEKYNKNVFTLRNYEDASKINNTAKNKKDIVIIGGGFIGMEMASMVKKGNKEANVSVVVSSKTPFIKELGVEVGTALQKLHEDNGVTFILDNQVKTVQGSGDSANKLVFANGEIKSCDMVILGTGSKPNTDFINKKLTMDGNHIKSNLFLHTSEENVFCAGDVASVPFINNGVRYKYGHWVNAQQQGAVSALNMLDKSIAYDYVPYYWTRMWDKTLQYTGTGESFDEVFVDGNLNKYEFVAYYFKNEKIVGFASMGVPNAANIMYEAFKANILPGGYLIKNGTLNLENIKQSLKKVKGKCSKSSCACSARI